MAAVEPTPEVDPATAEKAIVDEITAANVGVEVFTIHRSGKLILLRPPKLEEWEMMQNTVDLDRTQAINVLVAACVLYPPPPEFQRLRKRYPAMSMGDGSLFEQLRKIAGGGEKEEAKKA